MPDFSAEVKKGKLTRHVPEELVIERIDEGALRSARERSAARIRLIWEKRKFLLRATICGLVLGTVVAFLIPKRYKSTAELMPPDQSSGMGGALLSALSGSSGGALGNVGGGLASVAENALGIQTTGDLFVGILKSNTVRDDLIHKFSLQTLYGTRYIEDSRQALASHTDISVDSNSGILNITVTDHDPRRAAAMVQEYVSELNWVVTHLNTSSAHRERVFLDERLQQVKADLETAEQRFSQFASQKGAIDIPEQGKAMVTAAATLQGELIAAEADLNALKAIYTNNNVRVRSAQAQVNELRQQLELIGGKDADEKSSAQQLYPSLRQLPLLGVTYADLLRKAKVEQAVFETLTQEDELAKVQEAKETPSVNVLDPPRIPQKKSFPPRLSIMAVGTLLFLFLGTCWIFIDSSWKSIHPGDPRKALATEVLRDMRATLHWNARNGASDGRVRRWLRDRLGPSHEVDSVDRR